MCIFTPYNKETYSKRKTKQGISKPAFGKVLLISDCGMLKQKGVF